jgi:hypothetical protein
MLKIPRRQSRENAYLRAEAFSASSRIPVILPSVRMDENREWAILFACSIQQETTERTEIQASPSVFSVVSCCCSNALSEDLTTTDTNNTKTYGRK